MPTAARQQFDNSTFAEPFDAHSVLSAVTAILVIGAPYEKEQL
jgi:hypothetical protein